MTSTNGVRQALATWRPWAIGAAAIGLVLVLVMQAPAAAMLAALASLVTVMLLVAPKSALTAIAAFLVVQPVVVNLAGGPANPVGLALQRVDEVVVVASCLRISAMIGWQVTWPLMRPWVAYTAAFAAAGLLSGLVAGVPSAPLLLGTFLSLKFHVFLLLSLTIKWEEIDARNLLRAAMVVGPILLLLGVLLQVVPPDTRALFQSEAAAREEYFSRGGLNAMQGPFVHPGVFGWAMAVIGCYAIAALLTKKVRGAVATVVVSFIGILASLRRKPLIALPFAAVFGLVSQRNVRRRWTMLAALAALGLGVIVFSGDRLRLLVAETTRTYLDPYAPTTSRVLLYVTGYDIANERAPLGAGFGRFGGYASQLYYSPIYDEYGLSQVYGLAREAPDYIQDTYWPHIMGEAGWLGLAVLAGFFVTLVRRANAVSRTAIDSGTRILALGASMTLVEALVESVAAPIFEVTLAAFVVAVPLGIGLVIASRELR